MENKYLVLLVAISKRIKKINAENRKGSIAYMNHFGFEETKSAMKLIQIKVNNSARNPPDGVNELLSYV